MKRTAKRVGHRVRQRQIAFAKIATVSCAIGAGIFLIASAFFNVSNVSKSKAKTIEYIETVDQNFLYEMSIPAPVVRKSEPIGQDIIQIQKIKPTGMAPATYNE